MRGSTKAIDRARERQTMPHMFHRMTTAYMNNWWRIERWTDINGRNHSKDLRDHKDHRWWEGVRKENINKRKKEGGCVRIRAGMMYGTEDFIRKVVGEEWKEEMQQCKDEDEWMRKAEEKLDK